MVDGQHVRERVQLDMERARVAGARLADMRAQTRELAVTAQTLAHASRQLQAALRAHCEPELGVSDPEVRVEAVARQLARQESAWRALDEQLAVLSEHAQTDLHAAHRAAQEAQQKAVQQEQQSDESGSMEAQVERDWAWRVTGQRFASTSLKAALFVARSWTALVWDMPRCLLAQVSPPQRWVHALEPRHTLVREEKSAGEGASLAIRGGISDPLRRIKVLDRK